MHLYGALVHGRVSYAMICPDHEEQGHNATIQCIWMIIVDQYIQNGRKLPPVLFLQLDNTTKQNKGRFVLAFLALLVEHGIFERAYVCYLPVGHTHEDIDQMFSRLAIALRGKDMRDREEMTRVIQDAYTFEGVAPTVYHWTRIANLRDWLDPQITLPKGVMKFRHFRVGRSEEKGVMVQCRLKMRLDMEEDWRGIEDNTHRTFLFTTAYGIPDIIGAATRGAIPDTCKRHTSKAAVAELRENMRKLAAALPSFTVDNQADCEIIIKMYEGPPLPFHWNSRHIKMLFGQKRNGAGDVVGGVRAQRATISHQLGQIGAQLGKFYLVRPTMAWKGVCVWCFVCVCVVLCCVCVVSQTVLVCSWAASLLDRPHHGVGGSAARGRRPNSWVRGNHWHITSFVTRAQHSSVVCTAQVPDLVFQARRGNR